MGDGELEVGHKAAVELAEALYDARSAVIKDRNKREQLGQPMIAIYYGDVLRLMDQAATGLEQWLKNLHERGVTQDETIALGSAFTELQKAFKSADELLRAQRDRDYEQLVDMYRSLGEAMKEWINKISSVPHNVAIPPAIIPSKAVSAGVFRDIAVVTPPVAPMPVTIPEKIKEVDVKDLSAGQKKQLLTYANLLRSYQAKQGDTFGEGEAGKLPTFYEIKLPGIVVKNIVLPCLITVLPNNRVRLSWAAIGGIGISKPKAMDLDINTPIIFDQAVLNATFQKQKALPPLPPHAALIPAPAPIVTAASAAAPEAPPKSAEDALKSAIGSLREVVNIQQPLNFSSAQQLANDINRDVQQLSKDNYEDYLKWFAKTSVKFNDAERIVRQLPKAALAPIEVQRLYGQYLELYECVEPFRKAAAEALTIPKLAKGEVLSEMGIERQDLSPIIKTLEQFSELSAAIEDGIKNSANYEASARSFEKQGRSNQLEYKKIKNYLERYSLNIQLLLTNIQLFGKYQNKHISGIENMLAQMQDLLVRTQLSEMQTFLRQVADKYHDLTVVGRPFRGKQLDIVKDNIKVDIQRLKNHIAQLESEDFLRSKEAKELLPQLKAQRDRLQQALVPASSADIFARVRLSIDRVIADVIKKNEIIVSQIVDIIMDPIKTSAQKNAEIDKLPVIQQLSVKQKEMFSAKIFQFTPMLKQVDSILKRSGPKPNEAEVRGLLQSYGVPEEAKINFLESLFRGFTQRGGSALVASAAGLLTFVLTGAIVPAATVAVVGATAAAVGAAVSSIATRRAAQSEEVQKEQQMRDELQDILKNRTEFGDALGNRVVKFGGLEEFVEKYKDDIEVIGRLKKENNAEDCVKNFLRILGFDLQAEPDAVRQLIGKYREVSNSQLLIRSGWK